VHQIGALPLDLARLGAQTNVVRSLSTLAITLHLPRSIRVSVSCIAQGSFQIWAIRLHWTELD